MSERSEGVNNVQFSDIMGFVLTAVELEDFSIPYKVSILIA